MSQKVLSQPSSIQNLTILSNSPKKSVMAQKYIRLPQKGPQTIVVRYRHVWVPYGTKKNAISLIIFCFWIYFVPLVRVISSWSGTCKINCDRGTSVKSWISFAKVLLVYKECTWWCFLAYIKQSISLLSNVTSEHFVSLGQRNFLKSVYFLKDCTIVFSLKCIWLSSSVVSWLLTGVPWLWVVLCGTLCGQTLLLVPLT